MLRKPYTVKLIPYRKNLGEIMLRQTKDGMGLSEDGRYHFFIDEDLTDPDFVVVQGKGLRNIESFTVAPQNTIFLSTEPRSVLVYPRQYISQFGMVCTCQEGTEHPNLVLGPPVLPWFIGFTETKDGKCISNLDYSKLKNSTPEKTKLLSVITSNKAFTKGHLDRIRFVEKLKIHYGNNIDVFGRGYCDFDDKWEVLAPYKYHIVLENSSQPYYWTEKISDCFLSETFPFYYGCTNFSDYFPSDGFKFINIFNFDETVKNIDNFIAENIYEERKAILNVCKNKVLDEYNMFEYIASLCDRLDPLKPKKEITLYPCKTMQDWHNFYNFTVSRNVFKWKQKLKSIFGSNSPLSS